MPATFRLGYWAALAFAVMFAAPSTAPAATFSVLYKSCAKAGCKDGAWPVSIGVDDVGNLYGAMAGAYYEPLSEGLVAVPQAGVAFRLSPPGTGATDWTEAVLSRACYPSNQCQNQIPQDLVRDAAGDFFGTTLIGGTSGSIYEDRGTVFELSPPLPGATQWKRTVLYTFKGKTDGAYPQGGLIRDDAGNLYGTTAGQDAPFGVGLGIAGTAFKLSPPTSGRVAWKFTLLHTFCLVGSVTCSDGNLPQAVMVRDSVGNLYGTTSAGNRFYSGGGVFELSPPIPGGTGWSYRVLYSFCFLTSCRDGAQPAAPLTIGGDGTLYGTTVFGGGEQYRLDQLNSLGGTVFALTPPVPGKTVWKEKVLYSFCTLRNCADGAGPATRLVMDHAGRLYGGTSGGGYAAVAFEGVAGGTIFKLSPPAPGKTAWQETVLHKFCDWAICGEGGNPADLTYQGAESGTLYDGTSPLYGVATYGGRVAKTTFYAHGGGTVFELVP